MARAKRIRDEKPLDPVEVLRDTLARIDEMLRQLEPRVKQGDNPASSLYLKLMKQRGDTALKLKQIQPGRDKLLEWLVRIMTRGKP